MEIPGLAAATSFIHRLQLHPQIYDHFRRVMMDYSTDKLDIAGVVSKLDILFQHHPDLLNGYRIYLPPQIQATIPSPPPPQQFRKRCVNKPDLEILKPCIEFMNKVQKRFVDERGVVVEYLDTVKRLTQGKLCNKEAYNAIVKIFGIENKDLVDGFEFLLWSSKEIKKKISKPMEDEMFELDINLAQRQTTAKSANMLMNSLEEEQHETININDYFSAVSLGYIRKEYKEEGDSIITRLREDPRRVLPEILEKLEAKGEILMKKRRDLHKKKKISVTKSSV